jgi:2-dehydropantoate 2-reductase
MRYVIYGAGAIGGVLGAKLSIKGCDVALIARGEHLRAIQRDGLVAKLPEGPVTLQVAAFAHPAEVSLKQGDVVLLTMKTQDTEDALDQLERAGGNDLPIVCMQNGVENERIASRRFSSVYAGCVFLPAVFLVPGVVESATAPTAGTIDLGVYPEGPSPLLDTIASDMGQCAIDAQVLPDIMRWKYAKLLGNLVNALDAVVGPAASREAPDIRDALVSEGQQALGAAGIAFASDAEVKERRERVEIRFRSSGGRGGGSSWQSLARETGSIESDFLNGEIVMLGRQHGVPTPFNEAARRLANQVARNRLQPGAFGADNVRSLANSLIGQIAD